jgi:hypothetical protein
VTRLSTTGGHRDRDRIVEANLDMGNPSTAQQRPVWQVALIALTVLFVLSEAGFLLIAMVARSVIDGGATAHDGLLAALSNAFFVYGENASGAPVFMAKGFFLLPGFNSLYYLTFGLVEPVQTVPFITSGLAAVLIAMFALVAYLTLSAGRGVALKLLLALVVAVGWVVLYTAAEASMFANAFWTNINEHWLEIPAALISLLLVSAFTHRTSA